MCSTFTRQLRKAEKHLRAACPVLGSWIEEHGKCDLLPEFAREPYEALVRTVAHQQLHGKAAESILSRLTTRFPSDPFPTALQLSRMRLESYRKCGFSVAKANAIVGIAKATVKGDIPDRSHAESLTNDELIDSLTQLRGIGQWTVEMVLIFTLGRLDIMPVNDFGVRSGLMRMYALNEMPRPPEFATWTDSWSPYRSVGAWYLWRFVD